MSGEPEYDVAVVGAGIAGLTAAVALTRAGKSVTVFEARHEAGGRTRSLPLPDGGNIELGATWWWSNEPLIRAVLDELGIESFSERLTDGAWRLDGYPLAALAYRFVGGAQELARRLADRLADETLRLADPVHAVHLDDQGRVRISAERETVMARNAVIALPPALAVDRITFRPGLPAQLRALAERTAVFMGSVVKAVAVYEQNFWRGKYVPNAAISRHGPFGELHDHSGPGGQPPALFGFAPAARFVDSPSTAVGEAFIHQLTQLFGPDAMSPRMVSVLDWSRERYTSPSPPSPEATAFNYGAAEFQSALAGRIYWASTETAVANAGHIDGAILAGLRVATQLTDNRDH